MNLFLGFPDRYIRFLRLVFYNPPNLFNCSKQLDLVLSLFSLFSPFCPLPDSPHPYLTRCGVAPSRLCLSTSIVKKDSYNKVLKDVKVEKFDRNVSIKMEEIFHKEDFSMFG